MLYANNTMLQNQYNNAKLMDITSQWDALKAQQGICELVSLWIPMLLQQREE